MTLKIFQVVSFLQMLATAFFSITSFINLFQTSDIYLLFQTTAFVLMSSLAILLLNILNNNYPDKPITGRQKSVFNWLFILNFLLIAFLFGLIFAEYGELHSIANLIDRPVLSLPFKLLVLVFTYITLLVFQFIILYGLYSIRRQIYRNFMNKEFEFEGKIL
jgi:hypothetical protein